MFESLFPIFCFGVVIAVIVAKGLFMATEFAKAERASQNQANVEPPESLFASRTTSGAPSPVAPDPGQSSPGG